MVWGTGSRVVYCEMSVRYPTGDVRQAVEYKQDPSEELKILI